MIESRVDNRSLDPTKDRILDAAEKLFAEHGFDGTSIRRITQVAGVNVASVHYHFGSKEAVLRGVTDRVVGPIDRRRRELLDLAIGNDGQAPPDVETLMEAFVRADIEAVQSIGDRGPMVARFLGRTYSDQTPWIQEMAQDQFAGASGFLTAFARSVPELTAEELAWRIERVVAVIVHTFATWPAGGISTRGAERLIARLARFLSAGFSAPLPKSQTNRGTKPPT